MYSFTVEMHFGKVIHPKYCLPQFKLYFVAYAVIDAESAEQAVSIAYDRARRMMRSGFEMILKSCEVRGAEDEKSHC